MELHLCCEPNLGADYDDLLVAAQAAERAGFAGFFRSDHLMRTDGEPGLPGSTDAWITMAGLARETNRLRLGTLLTPVTFRSPGILAITVAQVDAMSGGRIELGLGAGWFADEHHAYGIPFPAPADRMGMLSEQLKVITGLWDTPVGQRFSFHGEQYELTDSPALPKPVQRPHPPIIMGGGGGPRSLRLAARYADEFNLAWRSLDDCRQIFDRLEQTLSTQNTGRRLRRSVAQMICMADTQAKARANANAVGMDVARLDRDGLFGTPEQVIDKLGRLADAGLDRVYLAIADLKDLDTINYLAQTLLSPDDLGTVRLLTHTPAQPAG